MRFHIDARERRVHKFSVLQTSNENRQRQCGIVATFGSVYGDNQMRKRRGDGNALGYLLRTVSDKQRICLWECVRYRMTPTACQKSVRITHHR